MERERDPLEIGVGPAAEGGEDSETPEGGQVARPRGMEQILCLPLELFQVWALG